MTWIQRIRPTAIIFGVLLTVIAIAILLDWRGEINIPNAGWAVIGMVATKLGDALIKLVEEV